MKRFKIFVVNSVILTITSLLINSIAISFNIYISNQIGAAAMGVFQLITSVYMFAITLAVSGIGLAATRLVSEELARGKSAMHAVRNCIIYALMFGLLSAILLALNARVIAVYWLNDKVSALPFYALAVSLPFIAVSTVFSGYFTAMRQVIKNASAQMLEQIARTLIIIYILAFFLPRGLEWAVFAIALGGTLSEMLSCLYLAILYLIEKRKRETTQVYGDNLVGRMLGISLPVAVSSYIRSGLLAVKQIITPIFLTKSGMTYDEALAKYGIIHGMVVPVILFPARLFYSVSSLLIPEISRLHVSNNPQRINYVIERTFKVTFMLGIGICGVLFAFAGDFAAVLYSSNAEVATFIRVFAFLAPAMYFDSIIDGFLKGLNRQLNVVYINIVETVTTIALILLLLPMYGVGGYIAVIFITEILNGTLSFRILWKETRCTVKIFDWIAKPTIAIIAAIMVVRIIPLSNLWINILIVGAIYLILLYVICGLRKQEFLQ